MRSAAAAVVLLMLAPMLSGCFGGGEDSLDEPETVFDTLCPEGIASNVWYHYANATDATTTSSVFNGSDVLVGNNAPVCALGTYYGIGMSTFEPTIGITSADNLYISSWGNGQSGSTAIVRCSGMIGMLGSVGYTCVDVYNPPTVPVANSNDPYVYVDPWTDRIMKFDMHALLGMTVEWSDNEGDSWSPPTVATGWSVQDHQTIASSPYNALAHPTTWVFCVNGNYPYPVCSSSQDGGATWGPEVPGAPTDCNSGGLTGHMIGANDGNIYRGNPSCDGGEGYSIYRTSNGGLTWTEHRLPTELTGKAETWNAEEAQVHPDEENNLHAMWHGSDNMPYYSYSRDEGDTWSDPIMIAPPAGLVGTGFPAVAAGAEGRVAFAYLGDSGNNTWNGYISIITDAFSDNPLITTVQLNEFGDPLDTTADCGYNRCGGFGDFIDILVDQHGRPWFGLSHNIVDEGIFGTIAIGPSLRGPLAPLPEMPLGGSSTLLSDPSGGNSTAQS